MSITFNTIGITLTDGTSVRVSAADGKDITTSRSRMIINDAHSVDLPLGLLTVRDEARFREQVILRSGGRAPGALDEIRRAAIEDYNSVPKEERRPGMRSAVTGAITQMSALDRNAAISDIFETVKDLAPSLFPGLGDKGLGRVTDIITTRAVLNETDGVILRAAGETLAFVDSMSRIAAVTPTGWGLREDIDLEDPQAQPNAPVARPAPAQAAEQARQPRPARETRPAERAQFDLFSPPQASKDVPETKNPAPPAQDPDAPKRVWPPEPEAAPIDPAPREPAAPAAAPVPEPAETVEKKRWPPRKPAPADAAPTPVAVDAAPAAQPKEEPDAAQRAIDAIDRMITGEPPKAAPATAREPGERQPRAAAAPKPEAAAPAAAPETADAISKFLEGLTADPVPGQNDDDIYNDPFFLDADPVFEEEDDRPSVFGA